MYMESFFRDLEQTFSDICFSGLKNISPSVLQKCKIYQGEFLELGMKEGGKLLELFIEKMKLYQVQEESIENVISAFCQMEFYLRHIMGNLEDN